MSTTRFRTRCLALALVLAAIPACSGRGPGADLPDVPAVDESPGPDSVLADVPGPDLPADAAPDAVPDAVADAMPDASDVPPDVPPDASDVPPDVPPPAPWWEGLAPVGPPLRSTIGVSSHMYGGTGPDENRDFELARYAELGVTQIRNDFLWEWLEPVQGQHDWEPVTGEVQRVKAAGGDVIAIVDYRVGWAENGGGDSGIDPAVYAAEAGAIAAQFCNDTKLYEIWNEPNGEGFWYPHPDPARYALFLQAAYAAVHAACPDARVILGGQGSTDSSLGWTFLRDVGSALPGICQSFDILAIHPYTFIQLWSPERDFRGDGDTYTYPGQTVMTRYARDRLADWGCPGKPVWFTEMGWPSYEIPEETVGRWLARSMLLAQRDGVGRYYWYTFWDGEPVTTGFRPHENYFGLFGWPGSPTEPRRPKPAWKDLLGLATTVGDARYAADVSGALGLPNDVYALAFLAADGAVVLAAWDGRDEPDDGPDGPGPGGPGTTEPLSLALPPDLLSVEIRDLTGTVTMPADAPASPLALTLTPAVQYVTMVRGVPR
jgi:hypothetical protein